MRVSRKKAQVKSGPNKGKLKKGCRYLKGDGAICKSPGKAKKKTSSRKRRRTGAAARARKGVAPATPNMNYLNVMRRRFKQGNCADKKKALREIRQIFRIMARKNAKKKRGESQDQANARRSNRWSSEFSKKTRATAEFCKGGSTSPRRVSAGERAFRSVGGHPCASANPPKWCR